MRRIHPIFLFCAFLTATLAGALMLQPAHADPTFAYTANAEGQAVDVDLGIGVTVPLLGNLQASATVDLARASSSLQNRPGTTPPCGNPTVPLATSGIGTGLDVVINTNVGNIILPIDLVDAESCAHLFDPGPNDDDAQVVSVDAYIDLGGLGEVNIIGAEAVGATTESALTDPYSSNSSATIAEATIGGLNVLSVVEADPLLTTGDIYSTSSTTMPWDGSPTAVHSESTSGVAGAGATPELFSGFLSQFLTADAISCTAEATVDEAGAPSAEFTMNFADARLSTDLGSGNLDVDLSIQPAGTVLNVQLLGITVVTVTVGADVQVTTDPPTPDPDPAVIQSATANGVALRISVVGDIPLLDVGTQIDIARCNAEATLYNEAPAATEIAMFDAQVIEDTVNVMWMTIDEETLEGFNLYRNDSTTVPAEPINDALIPGQYSGLPMGATYNQQDAGLAAGTYYYWLEVVEMDGSHALQGPISVEVEGPTAVTIDRLTTESRSPLPLALAGALALSAGLAATVVRRRRMR